MDTGLVLICQILLTQSHFTFSCLQSHRKIVSKEATAIRKRTLAELKQLSKCYRHNSDLLHATFELRALRSDMRKNYVVVKRSRKLMLQEMMAMNCTELMEYSGQPAIMMNRIFVQMLSFLEN